MSCFSIGGYSTTRPSLKGDPQACVFPFIFRGQMYTSCISFQTAKPFMEEAFSNELVQIPTVNEWCPLVGQYSVSGQNKRMWGYCVCAVKTNEPISNRPTTRQPTTKPPSLKNSNPTKFPTTKRVPTLSPVNILSSTLAPNITPYPTVATEQNFSSDPLKNPLITAGIGLGSSFVLIALIVFIVCCFGKIRRNKSTSNEKSISVTTPMKSGKSFGLPFARSRKTNPKQDQLVVAIPKDSPKIASRNTPPPPPPPPPPKYVDTPPNSNGRRKSLQSVAVETMTMTNKRRSSLIPKPPPIIKNSEKPSSGNNEDLEKYRKMLRIGLSHDAVKHAMSKDGVPFSKLPELS